MSKAIWWLALFCTYAYLMRLLFLFLARRRVLAHEGKAKEIHLGLGVAAMIAAASPAFLDIGARMLMGAGSYGNIELAIFIGLWVIAIAPAALQMRKVLREGGLNPDA
jgi:hypothetical protein